MRRQRTWKQLLTPDLKTDILRDKPYRFEKVMKGEIGPPGFCGCYPQYEVSIELALIYFCEIIDTIALWWLRRRRVRRARWA